jgi:hypothetical protein
MHLFMCVQFQAKITCRRPGNKSLSAVSHRLSTVEIRVLCSHQQLPRGLSQAQKGRQRVGCRSNKRKTTQSGSKSITLVSAGFTQLSRTAIGSANEAPLRKSAMLDLHITCHGAPAPLLSATWVNVHKARFVGHSAAACRAFPYGASSHSTPVS